MKSPTEEHAEAVYWILKYQRMTQENGYILKSGQIGRLICSVVDGLVA